MFKVLADEAFCKMFRVQKNGLYHIVCRIHDHWLAWGIKCFDWERSFSFQTLVKNYDQDMETLTKTQKQQVEKAEQSQTVDMKSAAKRLKVDQVCGGQEC